jgi:hypothetical protein
MKFISYFSESYFILYTFYKLVHISGDLNETKNRNRAQCWAANRPNAAASMPWQPGTISGPRTGQPMAMRQWPIWPSQLVLLTRARGHHDHGRVRRRGCHQWTGGLG